MRPETVLHKALGYVEPEGQRPSGPGASTEDLGPRVQRLLFFWALNRISGSLIA